MAPTPTAAERLIVALDVADVDQAEALVARLGDAVALYKLGPWLLLGRGFEGFLERLIAARKRVFLDVKSNDIPETMRASAAAAARRGVSFLTIHGHGEVTDAAVRAAVAGKGDSDLKILAVTALTSLGAGDVAGGDVGAAVLERAARARALGCDGVIASGREAASVRRMAGARPFLIVTPGIRPEGADEDDHKRPTRPAQAIAAGADYLVMGRPIVRAADPAAVARAVIAEMAQAFAAR